MSDSVMAVLTDNQSSTLALHSGYYQTKHARNAWHCLQRGVGLWVILHSLDKCDGDKSSIHNSPNQKKNKKEKK